MRKLDTSFATTTVSQPLKAGSVNHLQLAYQEVINSLALDLIGPSAQNNIVYVLFGCINTGSGLHYIISAGAVYYNGEVYLVDAVNFTATGSNVAVAAIATTFFTDISADPTTFSDTAAHNVHQIRKIVISAGASGSTIADFSAFKQTQLTVVNDQQSTLGSSFTVKFDQDKFTFFNSATVNTTIGFDFTNAIPGAVARLKWTWGSALTLTVTAGSGAVAYEEGGDISRAASHTNTMYFTYLGLNESGDHEVGYSISQVV